MFGFRDGKLQTGRIGFDTRFVEPGDVPPTVRNLAIGATAEWDGGLVARTPTGQFRRQKLAVSLDDPIAPGGKQESAIQLVDRVEPASGAVFGWFAAGKPAASDKGSSKSPVGKLLVASVDSRHDLLSGVDQSTLSTPVELALPPDAAGSPKFLRLSGLGDYLYVAWDNGRLLRYEIRDLDHPRLVEDLNLIDEPAVTLTVLEAFGRRHNAVGRRFERTSPSVVPRAQQSGSHARHRR